MIIVQARIDIDPVGKGRPRFARRVGYVAVCTPIETRRYELALARELYVACYDQGIKKPSELPIGVIVEFIFERPASHTKKQREQEFHVVTPDLDNLFKALVDAANGIVYKDDKQICRANMIKRYARENELPGIKVEFNDLRI